MRALVIGPVCIAAGVVGVPMVLMSSSGYIYLMKHKSETFEKFKEFHSEVENHRNKKIKFLRSDRGDGYLSYEFGLQLKQCGIVSQIHAT